jgi:hypothetical protein
MISSIQPNIKCDELIPDIRDGPVPSLVDTQPNAPLGREPEEVELKVDSKSVLTLAKNLVFHERNEHIDLRYHFVRNCLAGESVIATYISMMEQLADILMNALGRVKLHELCARIGMVQITSPRYKDWGEIKGWSRSLQQGTRIGGRLIEVIPGVQYSCIKPVAMLLILQLQVVVYFSE